MKPNRTQKPSARVVAKSAFSRFLPVFMLALLILGIFYVVQARRITRNLKSNEKQFITILSASLSGDIDASVTDLKLLAEYEPLRRFLDNPQPDNLSALAVSFRDFTKTKRMYDQVCLLDLQGMEVLRVNLDQSGATIVPESELQSKGDRYYFTESVSLTQGQTYFSPLDLNVEHDAIEVPLKPTIRLATPVFDSSGQKKGVIVLNYLAALLLSQLDVFTPNSLGQVMLLDAEGYWLRGPSRDMEWGFMYPDGKEKTFVRSFPEVWRAIQAASCGQLHTREGIFTYASVMPLSASCATSSNLVEPERSGLPHWVLLTEIDHKKEAAHTRPFLQIILLSGGLITLFLGVASWFIAGADMKRQRAERGILRAKEEWERTFDSVPDHIAVLDVNHRIMRVNKAMADSMGVPAEEAEGHACYTCVHQTNYPMESCPFSRMLADGSEHTLETYDERRNAHFLVTVTPLYDSDRTLIGGIHVARDITKRKQMEDVLRQAHDELEVRVRERTFELANANEQLRQEIEERKRVEVALQESERFLRSSIDALSAHLAILDEAGTIISVNKAWKDFADANGFRGGVQGVGTNYLRVCDVASGADANGASAVANGIRKILSRQTDQFELEYLALAPEEKRWFALRVMPFRGEGPVRAVVAHEDISERKRVEEQLLHDAFHDALTGLPNKALFLDRLELVDRRAKRGKDYRFAVLVMDLDHFKVINDSLGHAVGDEFLIGISRRVRECIRSSDTAARLGGDEFAILLDDIKDGGEAVRFAERLQTELSQAFNLAGQEAFTSASIGIALNETAYGRPEDLLRNADTAMYRAKALGRARHELFDLAMHAQVMKRLQLETELRKAIEREEFRVFYQPVVSLQTGRMDGLEALIRWQHPERGLVSPLEFIPLAEETGLIVPIGLWVLRDAARQVHDWHRRFENGLPLAIAVNLSPKQFLQPDLLEHIARILRETELDPSSLKLEITESAIMENAENTIAVLAGLKLLDIKLSIDDFGTGYSSLSYLHRFPVDTLKVDRSFVSNMTTGDENYEIVRTIINLAHTLGLAVVAEGPETAEQVAQLRTLGCEHGQGFFFARPMEAEKVEELLSTRHSFALIDAKR